MDHQKATNEKRGRRRARVRQSIRGTAEKPRISVFRSNHYLYAQLIDDEQGHTLASASSRKATKGNKSDQAKDVGHALAEVAKKLGILEAVFDRGAYAYHGRVKAVAEALRAAGIVI